MRNFVWFVAPLVAIGCSGGKSAPKKVDVAGRVLDSLDQPVVGVKVLVAGTLATTDISGNFSALGVPVPYSLVLDDSPGQRVVGYFGVTRNDPVLRSAASVAPRQA